MRHESLENIRSVEAPKRRRHEPTPYDVVQKSKQPCVDGKVAMVDRMREAMKRAEATEDDGSGDAFQ